MKQILKNRQSQAGSAIIIILVAIAMFAALSFAVGNMMRSGSAEKLSEERAELVAGEIIDYARQIKQAVQSIRIASGCDETEISFTQTSGDDYEHSPVARDECKIFHVNGAGVTYNAPSANANDGSPWEFTGRATVYGIGTTNTGANCPDCAELIAALYGIPDSVCLAINEQFGESSIPQDSGDVNIDRFAGAYATSSQIDNINGCSTNAVASCPGSAWENSVLWAKPTGCFQEVATGNNVFYQVLLAR